MQQRVLDSKRAKEKGKGAWNNRSNVTEKCCGEVHASKEEQLTMWGRVVGMATMKRGDLLNNGQTLLKAIDEREDKRSLAHWEGPT